MRYLSNVAEQEGMVLHFADGSIQACNSNAERILGVGPEHIQGWISLDPSWRALAEDGSSLMGEMHPAMVALSTGKPCLSVIMGVHRPNTGLIWLSVNSQPLFLANQTTPYAVVTTFFEITKQKLEQHRHQSTLEILNERFELAAAAVNCLIYDWDLETDRIERTCGLTEILGYQPLEAEPTAQWWQDRLHPEDKQKINQSNVWQNVSQNERYSCKYRVRHKDGHYLWVQDRQIVVKNSSGKPIRIVGSTIDLSDRQQAEASLRQSEERYRSLVMATSSIVWLADGNGAIVSAPEWEKFTGQTPEQYRGWGWLEAVHPNDRQLITEIKTQAIKAKTACEAEYRLLRRDGQYRYVHGRDVPILNEVGNVREWIGTITDISDRKQAEETLNANMAVLNAVNEATTTLIFAKDRQGRMLLANSATIRLIGKSEAEIIGHTDMEFLSDAVEAERVRENDLRVLSTGQIEVFEEEIEFPEGTRTYLSTKSAYRDKQGNIIGLIGVSTDITERKQTEIKLQESEERLRLAISGGKLGMWFWYLPTDELIWTDKCKELFGIAPDVQISYEVFINSLHPDDRDRTNQAVIRSQKDKVDYDIEYRIVWSDGSEHWIAAKAKCFYDQQGNAIKMMGTAQDITATKQAEIEREQILVRLQQYASQLQGLTEAALAINAALSIEEILQLITQQARFIIGAHQAISSITIDQNWAQAKHSISLSDKYAAWQDYQDYSEHLNGSGIYAPVWQTNRPMRMTQTELEAHFIWRRFGEATDKRPPLRGLLAAPLVGQNGRNVGLIQLSDKYEAEFTEEDEAILVQLAQVASVAIDNIRLYEAEQNAREQAEAANRVKDEFLAILSHELRSPLNPILGWTQLMQTYQLDQEKINQAITTIERNAKLLTQLIDDLLDIARILRGKLTLNIVPLDLDLAVKAAIETVSTAAAAKSISIETNLSPVGQVRGDIARLQQVIWNLLSNAIKFTPNGGRVEIQLKQVGERVQISVSDAGKGIAPEFLPHVFEYFRQADSSVTRNHGGLGIGLAIVRHLVELHGGEVAVTSPGLGQGAIFTVTLPLLQTRNKIESAPGESELEPNLPSIQGIRVLVVDDDLDNREFLTIMLKKYQAEVMAVASAMEVSSVLRTFRPDILVSDIGMPVIDGYTLIRSIRLLPPEQGGQIPAIAVTAYARAEERQKCFDSGFQYHLSKPIIAQQLVIAIAELVSKNYLV